MKLPVIAEGECSGHCCTRFPLSIDFSLTAIEVIDLFKKRPEKYGDGEFVRDMLVPHHGPWPQGGPQAYFTCRHYENQRCTRYTDPARPKMCADHGHWTRCSEEGCTYTVPEYTTDPVYWRGEVRSAWPRRRDPEVRAWMRETVVWLRAQGAAA